MSKQSIHTEQAPKAVGPYSQAMVSGNLVFLSGQIGLNLNGDMVEGFDAELDQIFKNLLEVLKASGCSFNDVVHFRVYLTDLSHFQKVNDKMASLLKKPYPARAAVEVSALPKGAQVEVEAIAQLP